MKKLILCGFLMLSVLGFTQNSKEANFKGGTEALSGYLSKNLESDTQKTPRNGTVYVEFSVEKNGKISNAKVLRGINPDLDKIALKAVSGMPAWEPAKNQKGKAVKSTMVLPIKFES